MIDLTKEIILKLDEIVKNFSDLLSISQQLVLKLDKLVQFTKLKQELGTIKIFNGHSEYDEYEDEIKSQLPKTILK